MRDQYFYLKCHFPTVVLTHFIGANQQPGYSDEEKAMEFGGKSTFWGDSLLNFSSRVL